MKLAIESVAKAFALEKKEIRPLEEINLEVQQGEFICVVGPSGCGKSTLLNIVAGLDKATSGRVVVDGKEVSGPGPDRVVMFQESALFPWLNVIQNVEFGLKMAGVSKNERREIALKYLRMVHLSKYQKSYIHQLSGGMRQRVALARALALNSDILLMDEPFAALDSQTRNILHAELQQIWAETKKTILFVTHNVQEAVYLGDRVIVLSAHPGRIKKEFKIPLSRPRDMKNLDLALLVNMIMDELKIEVEKVAKEELDSEWSYTENNLSVPPDHNLGSGI